MSDNRSVEGNAPTNQTYDMDNEEDLKAQLHVLREENRQLREEYLRAKRANYRRTAVGLILLGLVGVAGGLLFPDARDVLLALGGTGLFAGVLTYVLTPEQFVPASVGSRIFRSLVRDRTAIVSELGLSGSEVYVPGSEPRLFVPHHDTEQLPTEDALTNFFVVPEDDACRGISFHPTGSALLTELEENQPESVGTTPSRIASHAGDAVVELFELADGIGYDVEADGGRVTFEVDGTRYGPGSSLDNPIVSFLGVALATGLEVPVRPSVTDTDPLVVTYRFESRDE